MRQFLRFLIFSLFIFASSSFNTTEAQSRKAANADKRAAKEEAKAEKVKKRQKKEYLLSQKKDIKRRYQMQTPETRKRMKENKKRAKRINSQNHEPFLKKLFHHNKK